MVKTQADTEDDQNAKYLRAGVEPMYPRISIQVKEYVHIEFLIVKLTLQS
jgi:hypothetical protein